MIPKQAIEKAIEGGWEQEFISSHKWLNGSFSKAEVFIGHIRIYSKRGARVGLGTWRNAALDPTFWQALGKAHNQQNVFYGMDETPWWKREARRFYDLILTNGDTDRFWADLLR